MMVSWSLGPFIWQWVTSFKSPAEVSNLPPLLPSSWEGMNYISVLGNPEFLQVIVNSLIVSLGATGVSLAIGSLGAFGLSRLMRPAGKGFVMFALLVIFMIPQVAVVTPFYKMFVYFNLRDTLYGLILVYSVFTVPLVVWIMHQVFEEIPDSLYKAAQVDGCENWKIFYKVYLPLGGSGLVMAILGGAVITGIQGQISDLTGSIHIAYIVPLLCFGIVAYYGFIANRLLNK